MFEDVREKTLTLLGHKIYTNKGEGFQVGEQSPEPASRVWLTQDDISEWKQWVLLRHEPYHWQRAGGFSPPQTHYYSIARHSATMGPLDSERASDEAFEYEPERSSLSCHQPKTDW